MFQSSRMASGNCRLQVSMASSPFSASVIWKSSPSRIRRATLRMTLESSTTKQVFIMSSLHASRAHPVDVENDQEVPLEPVHARGDAAEIAIEIDRVGLALVVGQLEHFADRVDEK